MRLAPKPAFSTASVPEGASIVAGGRLPAQEGDFDAGHLVVPELEVAQAAAVVLEVAGPPRMSETMRSAATAACRSEKTPALGVPTLVTSPTANTPGYEVSRVRGLTGIHPLTVMPDSATTAGTRWAGTPRNSS